MTMIQAVRQLGAAASVTLATPMVGQLFVNDAADKREFVRSTSFAALGVGLPAAGMGALYLTGSSRVLAMTLGVGAALGAVAALNITGSRVGGGREFILQ
jgi:hypothetical protein